MLAHGLPVRLRQAVRREAVPRNRRGPEPVDARDAARGRRLGPLCVVERPGHHAHVREVHPGGLFWPACPPMGFPLHDIRDVAVMHALAMTNARTGRYLVPQSGHVQGLL